MTCLNINQLHSRSLFNLTFCVFYLTVFFLPTYAQSTATNLTTSTVSTNASSNALLDSLYIDIWKPGLGTDLTETVYKHHSLVGLFNSCRNAQIIPNESTASCFQDDIYNDRLKFQMSYRASGSSLKDIFEKHPPKLNVPNDAYAIAVPEIIDVKVDSAASTALVVVGYNCKSNMEGIISIDLNMHFGEEDSHIINIPWNKSCKSGKVDNIEFGYLSGDKTNSGAHHTSFENSTNPTLEVAPSDLSTEIYLKLNQPGAQQKFLAPLVSSSDEEITKISIRGNHPEGGVLEGLKTISFQLSYECLKHGTSEISVSVGIPPFKNLTAIWKKDCGGNTASSIQIGTEENGFDIVDNGKPTPRFMVGIENIGTAHTEEHLHLSGNQSDWTFYLKNEKSDSSGATSSDLALHIGRPTLTVEHGENVAALPTQISTKSTFGWSTETSSSFVLHPGESLKVSLHFICKNIGESRILITVPVLQYNTLEFGVAKECTHVNEARKSKQMVLTSEKALIVIFLVVILIAWYVWRRRRSKMRQDFIAVSTSEQ